MVKEFLVDWKSAPWWRRCLYLSVLLLVLGAAVLTVAWVIFLAGGIWIDLDNYLPDLATAYGIGGAYGVAVVTLGVIGWIGIGLEKPEGEDT